MRAACRLLRRRPIAGAVCGSRRRSAEQPKRNGRYPVQSNYLRRGSRVIARGSLCCATLASIYCSGDNARQPSVDPVKGVSQPITSVGWSPLGPYGTFQRGSNPAQYFSGVTTDVETPSSTVTRIATIGGGVFEWSGSRWVGLTDYISPANNPPKPCEGLSVNTLATMPDGTNNTIVMGTVDDSHINGNCQRSGIWRGQNSGSGWTWMRLLPSDGPAGVAVGEVSRIRWSSSSAVHAATSNGYFRSTQFGAASSI